MNPERRRKMPRPSAKRKDQVAPKAPEGLETGAQQVERVQTQAVIHPLPSQRTARVQDSPPLGSVMGSGSRTLLPAYVRSLLRTQESAVLSASVPSSSEVRRSEITPFSARSIEPPFIDTLETLRREVEDLQISPESSIYAPSGSGIRETGTIPAANLSSWEMQESNISARIQELFRGQEEIDKKLSDLLGSWNSSDGMPSGRRARRRRELSVEASSGLRTRRMETLPLDAQSRAGKRKLGTIPVLLKIPRSSMQGMGMSVDALSSSGLGISRILPSSTGMLPDSEVRQPELLSLPRTFVDSQTRCTTLLNEMETILQNTRTAQFLEHEILQQMFHKTVLQTAIQKCDEEIAQHTAEIFSILNSRNTERAAAGAERRNESKPYRCLVSTTIEEQSEDSSSSSSSE